MMPHPAHTTSATILIIDDHPLLRRGVKQLLDLEDDLLLVGESGEPEQGIALARELEPDLIRAYPCAASWRRASLLMICCQVPCL